MTRSDSRLASALESPGSSPPRPGVIRIVVVTGGRDLGSGPRAMAVETTTALARLGDPVELLRAEHPAELSLTLADPSIDLVLIDRVDGLRVAGLLEAIGPAGPPSVVVVEEGDGEDSLAAFRAGASDCVVFGPEHAQVLPVVLLEQIRRRRTDRQQHLALERIRWLESLNAAIVTAMPAGLAVVDRDGRLVAVNPEFDRLFPAPQPAARATVGEASSRPIEPLGGRLPREFLARIESLRRDAHGGSPRQAALVRVGESGGSERTYELRRRPLDAAGRELLLFSDVTESEWLSQRLETLQRDTRDIVENVNSALLVVDLAGRISFANPAAEQILGGVGGDLGGREIGDWFGHPGEVTNPIVACLERGTRSRGAETWLRRNDESWIPVGLSCSPRLDANGCSRGVVAIFQDLSLVKELEQQVRQSDKMASIGQLAAGLAHEVNNPMGFIQANLHQMTEYLTDLTRYFGQVDRLQAAVLAGDLGAIRGAAEALAGVSREIDLDYVRSDFEKALLESSEGAERIRHLVKDLRDFSRPDLPDRVATDVNQALDSTANIVQTMMKHTAVIEKNYGALPEIDAYPMQLKQVFMNLLVNAYQAIEAGERRVPGLIRLETRLLGEEIIVGISDTGIGIPPHLRARIFEPFFTTKPVGAGTGLGLSTSFTIVERHGGRIQVESEPGVGTRFEIRLPIQFPLQRDSLR